MVHALFVNKPYTLIYLFNCNGTEFLNISNLAGVLQKIGFSDLKLHLTVDEWPKHTAIMFFKITSVPVDSNMTSL